MLASEYLQFENEELGRSEYAKAVLEVADMAARLDYVDPMWYVVIDLRTFHIQRGDSCILGQRFPLDGYLDVLDYFNYFGQDSTRTQTILANYNDLWVKLIDGRQRELAGETSYV